MQVLMLVVNGIAGINFEHPIIRILLLSWQLENRAEWLAVSGVKVDTVADNNWGHLNLEPYVLY